MSKLGNRLAVGSNRISIILTKSENMVHGQLFAFVVWFFKIIYLLLSDPKMLGHAPVPPLPYDPAIGYAVEEKWIIAVIRFYEYLYYGQLKGR